MTERQSDGQGRRFPSHQELFTFGGLIVAIVWLISIADHSLSGRWELHRAAALQWIVIGAVFLPCVGMSALMSDGGALSSRRFARKILRAIDRASLARILGGAIAIITLLVLTLAKFMSLLPPFVTLILLLTVAVVALCFAFRCSDARRWPATTLIAQGVKLVARDAGILGNAHVGLGLARHTLFVGVLVGTTAWLVVGAHRGIALLLGLAQGLALLRLCRAGRLALGASIAIVAASIVAWVFSAGFTFTPIGEWLLGATESTAGSPFIFSATLALVLAELFLGRRSSCAVRGPRFTVFVAICAVAIFVALALRTDHLFSDWVPYHRSFWVGAADFVRQGGWLLWDVPSQYGFGSALLIAIWPASSTWQALYEQTAVALVSEAMILFWLFRFRRAGRFNIAFSILAPAGFFFSSLSARFPFGWRLYPQVGLRFTGVVALLAIAFFIYASREDRWRSRLGFAAGYAVWTASLLWSFESAVTASCVWVPFVTLDCVRQLFATRGGLRSSAFEGSRRLCPLVILPVVLVVFLEIVYRVALGHGPDWWSYVEFALQYNIGDVSQEPIEIHGPGWLLLAFLIACGAVTLRAARKGAIEAIPVLASAWFGLWSVCDYYVAEGFNNHVNGVAPVIATTVAVFLAVHRVRPGYDLVSLPLRAFVAPLFVLVVSHAMTDPQELRSLLAPFMGGHRFDSLANAPLVSGEVAGLLQQARVRPDDLIVYPASNWEIKPELGIILPFTLSASGAIVQQYAWLPISPIGPFDELFTLSPSRGRTYLRRYYEQVRKTGWLVAYHEKINCRRMYAKLETTNVYRSSNYEIARCRAQVRGSRSFDTAKGPNAHRSAVPSTDVGLGPDHPAGRVFARTASRDFKHARSGGSNRHISKQQ